MVLIPFTNSFPENFFCKHQYRNPDKETKEEHPFCCRAPDTHNQKGHWPCYYEEKEIRFNTLNREVSIIHQENQYPCRDFKPTSRIKGVASKIPTDLEIDAHKRCLSL